MVFRSTTFGIMKANAEDAATKENPDLFARFWIVSVLRALSRFSAGTAWLLR
jgi:hypothetical protein